MFRLMQDFCFQSLNIYTIYYVFTYVGQLSWSILRSLIQFRKVLIFSCVFRIFTFHDTCGYHCVKDFLRLDDFSVPELQLNGHILEQFMIITARGAMYIPTMRLY